MLICLTKKFVATIATSTALAAVCFTGLAHSGISLPSRLDAIAPDFSGIDAWHNSVPLHMEQLRGKVILVEFWTYACINCINTLPYVKSWHQKYSQNGLVVVGVHTPEFPFERNTENVKKAIKQLAISYPVAQDNQYITWSAYQNQYWPALYLIDKQGRIVYSHFGEGRYAETEATIKKLLAQ